MISYDMLNIMQAAVVMMCTMRMIVVVMMVFMIVVVMMVFMIVVMVFMIMMVVVVMVMVFMVMMMIVIMMMHIKAFLFLTIYCYLTVCSCNTAFLRFFFLKMNSRDSKCIHFFKKCILIRQKL